MRLSTSFSEDEINFLDELVKVMSRGGGPQILLRHRAFASVARKTIAMKERISKPGMRGHKAKVIVDEVIDFDPYAEGNQLGALNPGEEPDDGG